MVSICFLSFRFLYFYAFTFTLRTTQWRGTVLIFPVSKDSEAIRRLSVAHSPHLQAAVELVFARLQPVCFSSRALQALELLLGSGQNICGSSLLGPGSQQPFPALSPTLPIRKPSLPSHSPSVSHKEDSLLRSGPWRIRKIREPVQANGAKGRDSPKGPASNSPWKYWEASFCLLREGNFTCHSCWSGDHTMFNPPKLDMNYSKKLKKKKKEKTTLVVNWLLSDAEQGTKWGIWHRARAISEAIHLKQIHPWLQPWPTKYQELLQIAAHLPARDGSQPKLTNEGLLPGVNLCKAEQKRQHKCNKFNNHQELLDPKSPHSKLPQFEIHPHRRSHNSKGHCPPNPHEVYSARPSGEGVVLNHSLEKFLH